MVDWKEDGFHTVTAYLTIDGAADAIEFYKAAFGAEEVMRLPMPDGKLGHAEIRIGDTPIMLSDEYPDMDKLGPKSRGGPTSSLMIYVEDVDAEFAKAVEAGGIELRPVEDQFYGDRSGWIKDPFGHEWTISTHIEDLTEEQLIEKMGEMMGAPEEA